MCSCVHVFVLDNRFNFHITTLEPTVCFECSVSMFSVFQTWRRTSLLLCRGCPDSFPSTCVCPTGATRTSASDSRSNKTLSSPSCQTASDTRTKVRRHKHTQLYWIDLKRSDSSINTKSITNNSDDQLIVILNTNGQISVPAAQIWGFPGFLTLAVVESRIGRLMEIISSCSPNIEQYGLTYSMILIISDW